jgi:hypothetical protein
LKTCRITRWSASTKRSAITWLKQVAPGAKMAARNNSVLCLVYAVKSGIGVGPLPTALAPAYASRPQTHTPDIGIFRLHHRRTRVFEIDSDRIVARPKWTSRGPLFVGDLRWDIVGSASSASRMLSRVIRRSRAPATSVSATGISVGTHVFTISGIYDLTFTVGTPVNFGAVLSIAADSASAGIQTSTADFGHSLSVFFDVPVGYTFDTLSGHDYSSNAVGAVPEPSTWAMLLLGFAGIGFMA